ncbi:MAG: peptide deformylase [Elusimicrobia bacterium]|nr:peptide deformylase [Elusimicrobiota bacterium]
MAVLRITKYPEKVLKTKSKKVEGWSDELSKLVEDMFETMYAVSGVGLAANQIGIPLRLAVIDVRPGGQSRRLVLINPKLTALEGKQEEPEGCLSLPGIYKRLGRAAKARVLCYDQKGMPWEIRGTGLLARALQHEIDHLDGKLFVDRLSIMQKVNVQKEIKRYQTIWERQVTTRPALVAD